MQFSAFTRAAGQKGENVAQKVKMAQEIPRFVLYVHPKNEPSVKLMDFIVANNVVLDVVSSGFPSHITGVPTLADNVDQILYPGSKAFDKVVDIKRDQDQYRAYRAEQKRQEEAESAARAEEEARAARPSLRPAVTGGSSRLGAAVLSVPRSSGPRDPDKYSNKKITKDQIKAMANRRQQLLNRRRPAGLKPPTPVRI